MSIAIWWPAFTLGAWGELFFDQMLTVWVAATVGIVLVLTQPRSMGRRWWRVVALAVPSLWLALAFTPENPTGGLAVVILDLIAVVVGLLGIPFTLWTLVGILWPETFSALSRGVRWAIAGIVVAVAVGSFLLGVFNGRFLTCQDFELSGNSRPPGCVSATPAP
ncbi:MAG: hypothetical protein JST33_04570 [Actinobacteria bacterium]|nr:hypothetical protein [Actinomycetota bacterium]